jgi:hypothetical protein
VSELKLLKYEYSTFPVWVHLYIFCKGVIKGYVNVKKIETVIVAGFSDHSSCFLLEKDRNKIASNRRSKGKLKDRVFSLQLCSGIRA